MIVAARRREALERAIAGRENMCAMTFDVESAVSMATFPEEVLGKYPYLNVLFNNAGIMRYEPLGTKRDLADSTGPNGPGAPAGVEARQRLTVQQELGERRAIAFLGQSIADADRVKQLLRTGDDVVALRGACWGSPATVTRSGSGCWSVSATWCR